MFSAYGWAIVRSSRAPYVEIGDRLGLGSPAFIDALDSVDERVEQTDAKLFEALEAFLSNYQVPDLDWRLKRQMNNVSGVLLFASSTNHRCSPPTAIELLHWLAENGPGSYGLVYVHDDEDDGERGRLYGRVSADHSNEFRVWRLVGGMVEELGDPFLSPIVPLINPHPWA